MLIESVTKVTKTRRKDKYLVLLNEKVTRFTAIKPSNMFHQYEIEFKSDKMAKKNRKKISKAYSRLSKYPINLSTEEYEIILDKKNIFKKFAFQILCL